MLKALRGTGQGAGRIAAGRRLREPASTRRYRCVGRSPDNPGRPRSVASVADRPVSEKTWTSISI